jgi:hypothetical protein
MFGSYLVVVSGVGVAVGAGVWAGFSAGAGGCGDVGKYSGPFLPQAGRSAMAVSKESKTRCLRKCRIRIGPGYVVSGYGKLILIGLVSLT